MYEKSVSRDRGATCHMSDGVISHVVASWGPISFILASLIIRKIRPVYKTYQPYDFVQAPD